MKINFRPMLLITGIFIAFLVGFTNCNNDENVEIKTDKGEETFMSITLEFPDIKTSSLRSSSARSSSAIDEEAKINTVDVFIYTASGYFLSRTPLSISDFEQKESTGNADVYAYNAATKIKTTTGDKRVFVAINLPPALLSSLEDRNASELTQTAKILTRDSLITSNGFAMSSLLVDCSFTPDSDNPANNPVITVKRMVAKITVQKSASLVQSGIPGTLGKLMFVIDNFNNRSFLVQGAAPDYKDPNWESGSYNPAEFSSFNPGEYAEVNNPADSPVDFNRLYASENTSKDHKKKEITRAILRATFIPRDVISYQNGTDKSQGYKTVTSASLNITTPQTFYTITLSRPLPEMMIFYNEQTAKDYAADNGLKESDVATYSDGYCYWDLFLNKNKWDVLRNDYYKCTITRIVAPGRPTTEIPDPDTPPESDTNITVDVEILAWNEQSGNYQLEP
jgi:hypothetical protein